MSCAVLILFYFVFFGVVVFQNFDEI